jgi:hypothetical protein
MQAKQKIGGLTMHDCFFVKDKKDEKLICFIIQ